MSRWGDSAIQAQRCNGVETETWTCASVTVPSAPWATRSREAAMPASQRIWWLTASRTPAASAASTSATPVA